MPNFLAFFILTFNIYWFIQSMQIAYGAILSHLRIQASINYDWLGDIKSFPDWQKVHHIVVIPTYKEPLHILERTLKSLSDQDFNKRQMTVVLAMEQKESADDRNAKFQALNTKFGKEFHKLFMTIHPLLEGEVAGKASNERYAAILVKNKLLDEGLDMGYITVTSCDADHKFHPKHYSCLTFKFLDNPKRYRSFWQPAILFYNNIWELPALTRIPNTIGSIVGLSQLSRKDKLINVANYSLSLKLLDEVGYWDADKIPEDWGIFFKAFYKVRGGIEVEPLYLPIYADAPRSTTFWKTLKSQYEQYKRWAWGVSDDPWIIKNYFLTPGIPFWDKTARLLHALKAHFLWPVNWFLVTVGLTLPTLLNPAFSRTALGYTVPKLSSNILTVALIFLLVIIIISNMYKPERPAHISKWRVLLTPFEYLMMPIVGFFFGALPGLDAHTRLMLGKYLEYKVTEKV